MKITHEQAKRLVEITEGHAVPVQIPIGLENCLIRTDHRVNTLKEVAGDLALALAQSKLFTVKYMAVINAIDDLRGAAEKQ